MKVINVFIFFLVTCLVGQSLLACPTCYGLTLLAQKELNQKKNNTADQSNSPYNDDSHDEDYDGDDNQ